ncbi:MAG TPA: hypothetical protein VJN02_12885 [Gammaproteobacteria bacterium]|nr:hypothetical protein [Gammaproteobacteria bacterium]
MMKKEILMIVMMILFSASVMADPWFDVEIIKVEPHEGYIINGDDYVDVTVKISNVGSSAGSMKVETGIYKRDVINDWYNKDLFATFIPVANCEPYELNVDTKQYYLERGESVTAKFTMTAPSIGFFDKYAPTCYTGVPALGSLPCTDKFGVLTHSFLRCYNVNPDTGEADYDTQGIRIFSGSGTTKESCSDGQLNQDESDTDCGGNLCPKCRPNYECKVNEDCDYPEYYCGSNNQGEKICLKNSEYVPPSDGEYDETKCGNKVMDFGETCNTCRTDIESVTGKACPSPLEIKLRGMFSVIFIVLLIIVLMAIGVGWYMMRD